MLQRYSVCLRIYSWFIKYCHPKLASAGVIAGNVGRHQQMHGPRSDQRRTHWLPTWVLIQPCRCVPMCQSWCDNKLKAERQCFAWAIKGQGIRPIDCQHVRDKFDDEEIPSANLSITCKLNVLVPMHISYVGGISNSLEQFAASPREICPC